MVWTLKTKASSSPLTAIGAVREDQKHQSRREMPFNLKANIKRMAQSATVTIN